MTNPLRFLGRHAGASIVGGVAIAALAGGGIAYAATSSGTSSTASPPPASAPATTVPPSTSGGSSGAATTHGKQHKAHGIRGTITAINGSTWTLQTPKGQAVTVTITPQTKFGTAKAPATASSFTVGSPATVLGQRSGETAITATRIVVPQHTKGGSGTSTTAPASS